MAHNSGSSCDCEDCMTKDKKPVRRVHDIHVHIHDAGMSKAVPGGMAVAHGNKGGVGTKTSKGTLSRIRQGQGGPSVQRAKALAARKESERKTASSGGETKHDPSSGKFTS